jgi:hypothetical protein
MPEQNPVLFLDNDWLREVALQREFRIGGERVTLTLMKTGVVSVCREGRRCVEGDGGEEAYRQLERLLELLAE